MKRLQAARRPNKPMKKEESSDDEEEYAMYNPPNQNPMSGLSFC